MARPLRKVSRKGILYTRRDAVEDEITKLEKISEDELISRCVVLSKSQAPLDFISSEALVYLIRHTGNILVKERIFDILSKRIMRNLLSNTSNSIGETTIKEKVLDNFIDMLMTDTVSYNEQLDFYEINFNRSIKYDRLDAQRQVWSLENRTQELCNEDQEIFPEVENALNSYDPFDAHELDKENYRQRLNAEINTLSPLQQRIIEMWCLDIPITSKDPNEMTISKALKKSDKTIRIHRDRAFEILRKRLENKDKL